MEDRGQRPPGLAMGALSASHLKSASVAGVPGPPTRFYDASENLLCVIFIYKPLAKSQINLVK